jgi:hypothetical protein
MWCCSPHLLTCGHRGVNGGLGVLRTWFLTVFMTQGNQEAKQRVWRCAALLAGFIEAVKLTGLYLL